MRLNICILLDLCCIEITLNYGVAAEFGGSGDFGICGLWSYWKPLRVIFKSLIHVYMYCIFLKTTVGILCSLNNVYFIFRCGSPPREGACGNVGNELFLT